MSIPFIDEKHYEFVLSMSYMLDRLESIVQCTLSTACYFGEFCNEETVQRIKRGLFEYCCLLYLTPSVFTVCLCFGGACSFVVLYHEGP